MKTGIFCVFKVGVGKKGEARMKFFFVFKPRKWILCQNNDRSGRLFFGPTSNFGNFGNFGIFANFGNFYFVLEKNAFSEKCPKWPNTTLRVPPRVKICLFGGRGPRKASKMITFLDVVLEKKAFSEKCPKWPNTTLGDTRG